jgi:hypothetical protein
MCLLPTISIPATAGEPILTYAEDESRYGKKGIRWVCRERIKVVPVLFRSPYGAIAAVDGSWVVSPVHGQLKYRTETEDAKSI